jgi:diguanylate cyclase (GGDEF)-like protein/PAS domain S-box-containing protein
MKYKGRTIALIIWALRIGYMLYYITYVDNSLIFRIELIFTYFLIFPFWWLGKQYDKAEFFNEEINRSNDELKKTESQYRELVEMVPQALVVLDLNSKIVFGNSELINLLGVSSLQDIINRPIYDFISNDNKEETRTRLNYLLSGENLNWVEIEIVRPDGTTAFIETKSTQINFMGKKAILSVGNDISSKKKIQDQINYLAFFDSLTGLPNRYQFKTYLENYIHQNPMSEQEFALFFIDLDRFKFVNDTLGHDYGDLLLIEVAQRLKKSVRANDIVSRYAGDEFTIIIENADYSIVQLTAKRIVEEIAKPFLLKSKDVYVTTSVGISIFPSDGVDSDSLIVNADRAMYAAKKKGKNNFQLYDPAWATEQSRILSLEHRLRKAVFEKEFELYFQPQYHIHTEELVGMESLIRWNNRDLGFIPPSEFIPLAEEIGIINHIGKWVLKEACLQTKKWQNQGFKHITIAVNISVIQFNEPSFIDDVKLILAETKLEAKYLEIEITESIMQNKQHSLVILQELKKLGVKVSIDDFGTGFSSLSLLNRLPIDQLKIDRSFISGLGAEESMNTLVETIISMGHSLNFEIVAEGIEEEEQLVKLKEYHCDIGQGYYFSKPMPADKFELLLQKRSKRGEDK